MADDITSFIGKLTSLESQGQAQGNKNIINKGGERERVVYEATIFWETYHKLKHRWDKDVKPDTLLKEKAKGKDCCKSLVSKVTKEAKPVKVLERGEEKKGLSLAKKTVVTGIIAGALATAGVKKLLNMTDDIIKAFGKTDPKSEAKVKEWMQNQPASKIKGGVPGLDFKPSPPLGAGGAQGGRGSQGIGGLIPERTGAGVSQPTKSIAGVSHSNMLQGTEQAVGVSNRYLSEISAGIRNIAKGIGGGPGAGGNPTQQAMSQTTGNTYRDNSAAQGPAPTMVSSRGAYFDSPNSLNVPAIVA